MYLNKVANDLMRSEHWSKVLKEAGSYVGGKHLRQREQPVLRRTALGYSRPSKEVSAAGAE